MTIFDWVIYMLGIDPYTVAEYDYLIYGVSGCILVILFSSIYTVLLLLGGLIGSRR